MNKMQKPNMLAQALYDFFSNHLLRLRGMSPNTIHSYRDSLMLLLRFVADKSHRSITKLDIKDLSVSRIMDFLEMLEEQRGNKAATRNIRLASIHVFFSLHCRKIS